MPRREVYQRADAIIATVPWTELDENHMPIMRRYLLHGIRDESLYWLVVQRHPEIIPEGVDLDDLRLGAVLHDIGKPFVTGGDHTLWDRQTLSQLDRVRIRLHPVMSEELLERAKKSGIDVPNIALDIARYHHVRGNGGGYPRRPDGYILPAAVEVFAICDYIVALCEGPDVRPYRERGMNLREAYEVLVDLVGQRVFDKNYVDMVFDLIKSGAHMEDSECSWLGTWS